MREDAGFLLVEVLFAIVILGLAVAGILAGVGTAVAASGLGEQHTAVEAATRSVAEQVKATPFRTTCPATYTTTVPSGVVASVTVSYAVAAATPVWSAVCTPSADLHRVTITVASADGRVARALDILKRNPT